MKAQYGIWMGWLLCIAVSSVHCAEVLKVGSSQKVIAIGHLGTRPWEVSDYICIYRGASEIGCGSVIKTTTESAIVRMEAQAAPVLIGDEVRAAASGRKPATLLLNTASADQNAKVQNNNLTGGISAGASFFFPILHYQRALSPSVAVGLMPLYFQYSPQQDLEAGAFGFFLTGHYYFNQFFRGVWAQVGMGSLFYSTKNVEVRNKGTAFASLTTVGWRGYWDLGLNIGVAAGAQFVTDPEIPDVDIKYTGIQPIVLVDVGFNF